MTLKWIADRLKMATWTHVANRLYHEEMNLCQYSGLTRFQAINRAGRRPGWKLNRIKRKLARLETMNQV